MYSLIRSILFSMDPESAHKAALEGLKWVPSFIFHKSSSSPVETLGMRFLHPVGLAAGLDKNAEFLEPLSKLGFSFIEVGTTTPRAQTGNSKPRLFRLSKARALINRMGFNNLGVEQLVKNIESSNYSGILGINIGKNKDTLLNHAVYDYLFCLKKVYPYASYITVNISSPNTPDLRLLQQEAFLPSLLLSLIEEQKRLADKYKRFVPLLVKLSPDEPNDSLKKMAEVIGKSGVAGIIASNTTCARYQVEHLSQAKEIGGLSGRPLLERSTECLKLIKEVVGNQLTLIGVGGIDSVASAQEKINAGASLIQIYTGLIYEGPGLVNRLTKGLKFPHSWQP